jgi:hypothetical protein
LRNQTLQRQAPILHHTYGINGFLTDEGCFPLKLTENSHILIDFLLSGSGGAKMRRKCGILSKMTYFWPFFAKIKARRHPKTPPGPFGSTGAY